MSSFIVNIVHNKVVMAVFLTWFIAHFIKFFNASINHRKIVLKQFFAVGGMPSAHAATVTSLSISILLEEGLSTTFVVAVVLALIVMRDALGVRAVVDKHTLKLNKGKITQSERVGHTITEVVAGIVIGIVITLSLIHI